MFIDKPDVGTKVARDLKADYVLVYTLHNALEPETVVLFMRWEMAETRARTAGSLEWVALMNQYLEQDGVTPTSTFWNSTLLGKMIHSPHNSTPHRKMDGRSCTNLHPGSLCIIY